GHQKNLLSRVGIYTFDASRTAPEPTGYPANPGLLGRTFRKWDDWSIINRVHLITYDLSKTAGWLCLEHRIYPDRIARCRCHYCHFSRNGSSRSCSGQSESESNGLLVQSQADRVSHSALRG